MSVDSAEVGLTATEELYAPTGCGDEAAGPARSSSSPEDSGRPSSVADSVEWPVIGSTCA